MQYASMDANGRVPLISCPVAACTNLYFSCFIQGTKKRAWQRDFAHTFRTPLRVSHSFSTPCGHRALFALFALQSADQFDVCAL